MAVRTVAQKTLDEREAAARGCGEYREAGRLVARVSYNGRMWTPDGQEVR